MNISLKLNMVKLSIRRKNLINSTSRVRRPYVSSDNKVKTFPIENIISLDETSIQPAMIPEYSRCNLGNRCIVKTDDSYLYRKFTLLSKITYGYVLLIILSVLGGNFMKKEV